MKNQIYILFLLAFISLINVDLIAQQKPTIDLFKMEGNLTSKLDKSKTRLPGTKIYLKMNPKLDFEKYGSIFRKSLTEYINFVDLSTTSYTKMKDRFAKEELIKANLNPINYNKFKINEYECILIEGGSKNPDNTQMTMLTGNDDFVVFITAEIKKDNLEFRNEVMELISTINLNPKEKLDKMELANFQVDSNILNYKLTTSSASTFLYTPSSTFEAFNEYHNSFSIHSLPILSQEMAENIISTFVYRTERKGLVIGKKTTQESQFGKEPNVYKATYLESYVQDGSNIGLAYFIIIRGEKSSIGFFGFGEKMDQQHLDILIKTANSLKFKN